MWKRILSIMQQGIGLPGAYPEYRRNETDVLLLRWVTLSISVLAALVALQACRVFEMLDEQQLYILAGHPFYMSAEDAQVTLFSQGSTFAACVAITLYLGAVLLLQQRMSRRNHICLLAAVAVFMPGLMCVLWHGVLYVTQPLVCILLMWVILVPLSLIRRRIIS